MMKKYYELTKATKEIAYHSFNEKIKESVFDGCTQLDADLDNKVISRFESEADALAALKNFKSCARKTSGFSCKIIQVEEFFVQEAIYAIDEDGEEEFFEGGDICDFARNNFSELFEDECEDDE